MTGAQLMSALSENEATPEELKAAGLTDSAWCGSISGRHRSPTPRRLGRDRRTDRRVRTAGEEGLGTRLGVRVLSVAGSYHSPLTFFPLRTRILNSRRMRSRGGSIPLPVRELQILGKLGQAAMSSTCTKPIRPSIQGFVLTGKRRADHVRRQDRRACCMQRHAADLDHRAFGHWPVALQIQHAAEQQVRFGADNAEGRGVRRLQRDPQQRPGVERAVVVGVGRQDQAVRECDVRRHRVQGLGFRV